MVRLVKCTRKALVAAGMLLLVVIPAQGQTDVGNFKVPDVDEQGVLKSLMTGEKARMYPDRPMQIEGLVIEFYEPDGETVKVRLTSPGCAYDTRTNNAQSDQPVRIAGKQFEITGTGYVYDSNTGRMEILRDAKVVFRNLNFTKPLPVKTDTP